MNQTNSLPKTIIEAFNKLEELKFLTSTEHALLYFIDAQNIIKLFDHDVEYEVSLFLRRKMIRRDFPRFARIKAIKKGKFPIDYDYGFPYALICECLEKLPAAIKQNLRYLSEFLETRNLHWSNVYPNPKVFQNFIRVLEGRKTDLKIIDTAQEIFAIFESAKEIGLEITDFHDNNLGLKNGRLAMFDVR